MLARSIFRARLTSSQDDLKASRASYDQATGSAVSSAAGHRQTVEPEITVPTSLPTVGPAGSIFSNERVVFPTPVERAASEILTPGLRQLKPTPPRSANTFELEASDPEEMYQPHDVFRDPEHVLFATLGDSSPRNIFSKDADCLDLRYFPELDRNANFDHFNEITTSYSDSIKDLPPMGRSQPCLDIVDRMMQGDGEMVLFGRWRHRKDAPLSQVKAMIEQELRGPGACSLYGPGGLQTSEHPLVVHYNERVEKIQEENINNLQEPKTPLLSPVLLQGSCASQRYSMRSSTPVTFGISKDGTFQTTGFQTRTASAGSTVESMSPTESSELATYSAQKDTRRDSGVHIVQPDTSSEQVLDRTGHASLGNYDVLRYYSPDPTLDYKALNDETAPEYNREQRPRVTRGYIDQFCRGFITTARNLNGRPAAPARGPQQQSTHSQNPQDLAHKGTPQCQGPQAPHNRNATRGHPAMLGYELQRSQKRYGQQEHRDYTAHQQERPHQALEVKQQKHVRLDETKNVSYVIPASQDRKITLFATEEEDTENAVFSDDEDDAADKDATNPSQPRMPSSTGLLNRKSSSNASPGTHRTMPMPRSILKTSSSYAAASISSSAASATAKETAGLNTSTELTPQHATPGTTASSGREYHIKSPALARSITRALDERLKQMETHLSNKNCISL